MIQKLKTAWGALPHAVQALIIAFVSGTLASLGKAYSDPEKACWTLLCVRSYFATALGAGFVAARAFYMVPNRPPPQEKIP